MPRSITAAIEEQIATVAAQVPPIAADILAVAAEIGQIPRRVAEATGAQITAQIAEITPEIGAVASKIAEIAANVTAIGMNVSAMSIPTGRCRRRGESRAADRGGSHKYQNQVANHDDPPAICPKFSPRQLKRTSSEPPVCREFIIDLSLLSFRNVCAVRAILARLVLVRVPGIGPSSLGGSPERALKTRVTCRSPRQICC